MRFHALLKGLRSSAAAKSNKARCPRRREQARRRRRRCRVEQLEDRTLLSVFTVTTAADTNLNPTADPSQPVSLRDAINAGAAGQDPAKGLGAPEHDLAPALLDWAGVANELERVAQALIEDDLGGHPAVRAAEDDRGRLLAGGQAGPVLEALAGMRGLAGNESLVTLFECFPRGYRIAIGHGEHSAAASHEALTNAK